MSQRRTKKTPPKKTPPKESSKKTRKTHRDRTYKTYIQLLFKSEAVHPELQLKEKSKDQLDQLLKALVGAVRMAATALIVNAEKVTIGSTEVMHAVKALVSPGTLSDVLFDQGTSAIASFKINKGTNIKSKAKRAGLIFPIGLTEGLLSMKEQTDSKKKVSFRTGEGAAIYLAAVLEKISYMILIDAGNFVQDDVRKQVTVSDLSDAVKANQDLNTLFDKLGIRMTDAKVLPGVDQRLLLSKEEKAQKTKARAAHRKTAGTAGTGRKRALPGVKALRDIKSIQDSSAVVIPKQSFKALVKGVIKIVGAPVDYRYGGDALDLLQRGIEDYMVVVFRKANALALHRNGKRVFPEDLVTVEKMESLNGPEPGDGYKKLENIPLSVSSKLVEEANKITKPAIKRLAQRAGVLFMGQKVNTVVKEKVYIQARAMIQTMLERVLKPAAISTIYRNAKTLNVEDVLFGFRINNLTLLYSPLSAKEKKVKATTVVAKKEPAKKTSAKKSPKRSPPRKKSPKRSPPRKKSPKRGRKKAAKK